MRYLKFCLLNLLSQAVPFAPNQTYFKLILTNENQKLPRQILILAFALFLQILSIDEYEHLQQDLPS